MFETIAVSVALEHAGWAQRPVSQLLIGPINDEFGAAVTTATRACALRQLEEGCTTRDAKVDEHCVERPESLYNTRSARRNRMRGTLNSLSRNKADACGCSNQLEDTLGEHVMLRCKKGLLEVLCE